MNNRKRGDYFERQTRDDLERRGWYVIRSAGSLGPFDLCAVRRERPPLFVSCKLNGRLDPGEWHALLEICATFGSVPILAERDRPGHVLYTQLLAPKSEARRTAIRKAWRPIDGRSNT